MTEKKTTSRKARGGSRSKATAGAAPPLPPLSEKELAALTAAVRAGEEAVSGSVDVVAAAVAGVARTERTVAETLARAQADEAEQG